MKIKFINKVGVLYTLYVHWEEGKNFKYKMISLNCNDPLIFYGYNVFQCILIFSISDLIQDLNKQLNTDQLLSRRKMIGVFVS